MGALNRHKQNANFFKNNQQKTTKNFCVVCFVSDIDDDKKQKQKKNLTSFFNSITTQLRLEHGCHLLNNHIQNL